MWVFAQIEVRLAVERPSPAARPILQRLPHRTPPLPPSRLALVAIRELGADFRCGAVVHGALDEDPAGVGVAGLGDPPRDPLQGVPGGRDVAGDPDLAPGPWFGDGDGGLFFMDVQSDVESGRRV